MSKWASTVLIRSIHTGHREVSKVCEMLSFSTVPMKGTLKYHLPFTKCKNLIININIAGGILFTVFVIEDYRHFYRYCSRV
jgi:hypothetical protein